MTRHISLQVVEVEVVAGGNMPIAQINSNGTVRIYNKKTGEMRDVTPEELPMFNPALIGEYQTKLKEQQADQATLELTQSGEIDLKNLAKDNPILAKQAKDKGVKGKKVLSAADQKKADSLGGINNLIANLEKHYQAAGGGEVDVPILSRILGAQKDIGGKLGFNDSANVYNREKEGFAATLKSLTGDTGVLTDQDYARLQKLLPGLGSKPQEAKNLLNDLRSQVAAIFGGKAEGTTVDPKEKNILQILFPETAKLPENTNKILTKQAQIQSSQPSGKGNLGQATKNALATTLGIAPDVLSTSFGPALEAASNLALAKAVPGILKGAKSIPGKVFPQGAGKATRDEAIEVASKGGLKVDGSKIYKSVEDWAKDAKLANPASKNSIDKYVEGAKESFDGKNLDPKDVKNLWDNANKGFSAAGTKGSSLVASYHRAVRDTARNVLDEVAPGFEEGTQMIRKGLQRKDVISKGGKIAGGAAVSGLTSALLFDYLLKRNRQ